MHTHSVDQHIHDHVFLGDKHAENECRTLFVVALTLVMMIGEITAGSFFGSMALLADGWHMGTHAAAMGIAGAAYLFARRQSGNARFSFGTGKFGDLAAFSSALILGIIAIHLVSAWLLRGSHDHHHGHAHEHDHDHHHLHHHHQRDNNFRAAYIHVL